MKIGLDYNSALNMPFGELCDLVAVEQIKNEGAKYKRRKTQEEEEVEFWQIIMMN